MLTKINSIIKDKNLISENDSVLIAVSGGVDSMVLSHILIHLGYKIAFAHVNHKLRAEDSNMDEVLVQNFGLENNIACHIIDLPESIKGSKNFQNQARNFRYQWFDQLCEQHRYTKIATAHHFNDEIETFFMHLLRAAGINGLSGMNDNLNNKIIRPLLSVTKDEIYNFASQHCVPFREDLSNEDNKYLRNKIRNVLIPTITKVDQNAEINISKSIQHLKETDALLQSFIHNSQLVDATDGITKIDLKGLNAYSNAASILFYIAKPFGFNRKQTDAILFSNAIGAKSLTELHILKKDRSFITIKPIAETLRFEVTILSPGIYDVNGQRLSISMIQKNEITFQKGAEYLGFMDNPFPLTARSRKTGDVFTPLGMNGLSKTLKKFIVDEKMDSAEKENMIVLEHNENICYVMPFRISENHKVKANNAYILKVEFC